MVWVVIHMACGLSEALDAEKALAGEGVFCKKRPVYKIRCEEKNYYEILTLGCESKEARQILSEHMLQAGFCRRQ